MERRKLVCGCTLGWERCIDCRAGLHLDQETALAVTLARAKQDLAGKQEPLGDDFQKILEDHRWELYAR